MALLRLQQDIHSRRKLQVECEGSLEPFWMAAGEPGLPCGGEDGLGCRCSQAAKAAACRGLGGPCCPCPELCRAQLGLQTLRFQPCCSQCSLCITLWGLCLHRAGLWHSELGSLATAKGGLGGWILPAFGGRGQCLHSLVLHSIP